jgi:hypothetical protein
MADFDAIPDAVNHVIPRLFIKTDAKHAYQGFNRERGIIGDRLPHLGVFLVVITSRAD